MNLVTDIYEYSEGWAGAPSMNGSAHAVSGEAEPENDAVRMLHEAVEQVTGKPVSILPKPRIGFLP